MPPFSTPELQLAYEFVESTGLNIFLTGKAGTGKTTFLHDLKRLSPKRMIVVAPTGVAAINAGGVTIHSFFQLPFSPFIPSEINSNVIQTDRGRAFKKDSRRFNREKLQIIRSLDLLIIDEISMVRADLLDSIDEVLRLFRDKNKPFGGVQLLMIGDLQQLAPVAKEEEWSILRNYYDSVFFFSSHALKKTHFICIELKQIFRQKDQFFIDLLNKVRENNIDKDTLSILNDRFIPDFTPDDEEGYIVLTTHNAKAKEINENKLDELPGDPHLFKASIEGDFPEYAFPTDPELNLKVGAQVMFVRNDPSAEKLYFNGKIGAIADIDEDMIFVECPEDDSSIEVSPVEWQNIKYSLDEESKAIREEVTGTFVQYPLKTAWAITIHKSQGLTFEKAVIDARSAFAHGQVYVALSRCKSLEGLVLSTPLVNPGILSNPVVSDFISDIERNPPGKEFLERSKQAYYQVLLLDLFDFSAIKKPMLQTIRLANEHKTILIGNLLQVLEKMLPDYEKEINGVAVKFAIQLKHYSSAEGSKEDPSYLQERIIKGVNYFIEKSNSILISGLQEIKFETDNTAVHKLVKEAIGKLAEIILSKLFCLESCRNGFSVKEYLSARAKAVLDAPELTRKTIKEKKPEEILSIKYPSLYNNLKTWRNQKMRELDLPAYMIVQTKTMASLATLLPSTRTELLRIKGMGKKKVEQYGDEILAIISDYCRHHKIEQLPLEAQPGKRIRKKGESMEISFRMYKEGKTVDEIAEERGITRQTILEHLALYVETGELDIHQFVSPEKVSKIRAYFQQSETKHLTTAREALGEDFSYPELKLVLKYMTYLSEL